MSKRTIGENVGNLLILSRVSENPVRYRCKCLLCGCAVDLLHCRIGTGKTTHACPDCVRGPCVICGGKIASTNVVKKTCSDECAAKQSRKRERAYYYKNREHILYRKKDFYENMEGEEKENRKANIKRLAVERKRQAALSGIFLLKERLTSESTENERD